MSEAANKIYTENLLNEIEVAFTYSHEDDSSELPLRGNSYVQNAIRLYEEKLDQLFDQHVPANKIKNKNTYEEWITLVKSKSQSDTFRPIFSKNNWLATEDTGYKTSNYPKSDVASNTKLFNIAKELFETEKTYVDILHLLDQIFFKKILEAALEKEMLPSGEVKKMFPNLSSIYHLHSQFLLPQLKARLKEWDTNPRIGDVMIQVAPFLKMYSLYIHDLDSARAKVNEWMEKSEAFSKLINELQTMSKCKNLTLQHHMLVPVQRTPRYQMLLERCIDILPAGSSNREETEKALVLVKIAANHSNEFMKSMESHLKSVKILSDMDNVDFTVDVPNRMFIKEGKITFLEDHNGNPEDRYIFLFSDIFVSCKENRALSQLRKHPYRLLEKVDVSGMTIVDLQHSSKPNVFCVHGIQYSIEYACETAQDKDQWIQAFKDTIARNNENDRLLCRLESSSAARSMDRYSALSENLPEVPIFSISSHIALSDEELGRRAPHWVRDDDVTMCMLCSKVLRRVITKRQQFHCRACGRVICSSCPSYNVVLEYNTSKQPQEVCERCFAVLTLRKHELCQDTLEENQLFKVSATSLIENNLVSDYLDYAENDKTKNTLWCVVPKDESKYIYCYKACKDVKAHFVVNLVGSDVSLNTETIDIGVGFKVCDVYEREFMFFHKDFSIISKWKQTLNKIVT